MTTVEEIDEYYWNKITTTSTIKAGTCVSLNGTDRLDGCIWLVCVMKCDPYHFPSIWFQFIVSANVWSRKCVFRKWNSLAVMLPSLLLYLVIPSTPLKSCHVLLLLRPNRPSLHAIWSLHPIWSLANRLGVVWEKIPELLHPFDWHACILATAEGDKLSSHQKLKTNGAPLHFCHMVAWFW